MFILVDVKYCVCLIITVSCYRLDGFLQLMWMKKECSKAQMLLVWLPLNQEPSSIYCSQRKLLSLSRKITQGEKKQNKKTNKELFLLFCWILIFQRVFLLCLSSIMHQLLSLLDVLFNFCTGEKRKKWLAVCQPLCALQRLY